MREVVITGVGAASPVGNTLDEARDTYLAGRAVYTLDDPGTSSRVRVSARVREDLTAGLPTSTVKLADRCALLALQSSIRAMTDAGYLDGGYDDTRFGTFLGCGSGSLETMYALHESLLLRNAMSATSLVKVLPNAPASHVSMRFGLRGECLTFAIACASSAVALGSAYKAIRYGELDYAIAGGVETPFSEASIRAWEAMRVMARNDPEKPGASCRPYSKDRTGIVLGEGGAMFVLESAESAKARGAHVYATIAGYGASGDASHITLPQQAGQVAAMRNALRDASMTPADIDYINAHGTATEQGDLIETRSMRETFGAEADATPMSATKSIHGHLLGGSGAIEMLAVLVALRDGLLPPTINLDTPDPECDLDYVANVARQGVDVRAVMTNSFAFGGSNASMILRR